MKNWLDKKVVVLERLNVLNIVDKDLVKLILNLERKAQSVDNLREDLSLLQVQNKPIFNNAVSLLNEAKRHPQFLEYCKVHLNLKSIENINIWSFSQFS